MLELLSGLATDAESWILTIAASPWIYLVLFAFTTLDGFFPPVPSESVVITLAVAAHSTGQPNMWLVVAVAAVAAWTGDQIAYAIGRWVGTDRVPFLRSVRGRKAVRWARRALAHRGASFILAARYIPIGRIAVNMTAGALGYKRERFVFVTAVAAVLWSSYSVLIGYAAASWLDHSTLAAMGVGIFFGVLAGFVLDRVMSVIAGRRGAAPEDDDDHAPHDPQTPAPEDRADERPGDPDHPEARGPATGTPSGHRAELAEL